MTPETLIVNEIYRAGLPLRRKKAFFRGDLIVLGLPRSYFQEKGLSSTQIKKALKQGHSYLYEVKIGKTKPGQGITHQAMICLRSTEYRRRRWLVPFLKLSRAIVRRIRWAVEFCLRRFSPRTRLPGAYER